MKKIAGFTKDKQGSALVTVMVVTGVMGMVVLYSLTASKQDSHQAHRILNAVQARYMAEGALMRAKGDLLCQIAATNFLGGEHGGAFETVAQKYAGIDSRFTAKRIPGEQDDIDWESTDTIANAMWNFADDTSLAISGTGDWSYGSGEPLGPVRAYVTRSFIDEDGNRATNAVGSYSATLTAWARVGNAEQVVSKTFHHQMSFPRLFDNLLMGNALSDCSICHIKIHGDIAQINPDDAMEMHISYDSSRFNKTSVYGSIYTNGDFIRKAQAEGIADNARQENMLNNPGAEDQLIWARNGGALNTSWNSSNSGKGTNPYRDVASLPEDKELPSIWPSVKDNIVYWFEPRAMAEAAIGMSEIRTKYVLDNKIQTPQASPFRSYLAVSGSTRTTHIGWKLNDNKVLDAAGTTHYHYAIDRVQHWRNNTTTMRGTTNANSDVRNRYLFYDYGLHPADDLDGDSIPNGFDADIDGDGIPETPRAADDFNDPLYQLVDGVDLTHLPVRAAAAGGGVYGHYIDNGGILRTVTGRAWTLGRTWSSPNWTRAANYESVNMAAFNADLSFLYRKGKDSGNVDRYYWAAEVTGIATSLEKLIDGEFASTEGADPGTIQGVFPNDDLNADGNPDYTIGDGSDRCLIIKGSKNNPILFKGQVVVRGDILYTGYTDGKGVLLAHRNIYLPTDVRYVNPPDWEDPTSLGDQLGLLAGGNVVIGNFVHNTSGASDLLEFVWGNMVNINDPAMKSFNWGRDGSKYKHNNHQINPVYLMDGEEGGYWQDGTWIEENSGNTVVESFKYGYYRTNADSYLMRIGGGLDTSAASFNADRKHLHFGGVSNSHADAQTSYYKQYYISTPGLLPLGANNLTVHPPTLYAAWTGPAWLSSDDFKYFTLIPFTRTNADRLGTGIGVEVNKGVNWIKHVEAILYADYGVIGGNIVVESGGANYLEFKGAVIGRDIQIISAVQSNPHDNGNLETKFTNLVGGLYYDRRLKGAINPLGFPFGENFVGGEMTMNGIPQMVEGSRDNWEPFRIRSAYNKLFTMSVDGN